MISTTGDQPGAVRRLDEVHRDDRLEHDRELRAHLRLLPRRAGVDDAVDRLRGAVRVQRREDEVARLGRRDRGLHRLPVAHLADHDDVGVLPHHVLQGLVEARACRSTTSRCETAALPSAKRNSIGSSIVTMWTGRFSMIERMIAGERRRLARARRARDQDEARREVDEASRAPRAGSSSVIDGQLEGDAAEDGGVGAALHEDVAAEAGDARQAVADVHGLVLLEPLLLGRASGSRAASPRGPWAAGRRCSGG